MEIIKFTKKQQAELFFHNNIIAMNYILNKESDRLDEMIVYKLVDSKGNSYTIKGIYLKDYENGDSLERRKMAKVLLMLRRTNFKVTELEGIQKFPPLEYFNKLKEEALKLYTITYNQVEGKRGIPYDIYGLSTHSNHHFGHFHFRIYDLKYYEQVLSALLPLIAESGIPCVQKSSLISGDSRQQ